MQAVNLVLWVFQHEKKAISIWLYYIHPTLMYSNVDMENVWYGKSNVTHPHRERRYIEPHQIYYIMDLRKYIKFRDSVPWAEIKYGKKTKKIKSSVGETENHTRFDCTKYKNYVPGMEKSWIWWLMLSTVICILHIPCGNDSPSLDKASALRFLSLTMWEIV